MKYLPVRAAVSAVLDDLRFAVRVYRRHATSVALVVGGLAVAVGLTTALFAVMNAVMFRSVSVPNQAALRWVRAGGPGATFGTLTRTNWTLPEFRALQQVPGPGRTMGVLQTSARARSGNVILAQAVPVWFVGAGFFESMRATPARGRLLEAGDQRQAAGAPVVMHHAVWARAFGRDPSVLGRTVLLNDRPFTVVGIAAAGFDGPATAPPAFWAPLETYDRDWRDGASLATAGSPNIGVLVERATGMHDDALRGRLLAAVGHVQADIDVTLLPISDQSNVREAVPVSLPIRTLLVLVLLLGCANVATLLMASQMARRSELATRAALGASRARLLRQLMTEGMLLGAAGGALGGVLAFWAGRLLLSLIHVGPTIDIAADWRTLVFIGLASLMSGVVSSLAPALRASRTDLRSWLGHDAAHTSGSGRFGSMVIAGQAALCMAVVACAVLLAQSARRAQDVTVGFDAASVWTTGLGGAVRSPEISRSDANMALEAVRPLPAVAASAMGRGSSAGGSSHSLTVQSPAGLYRLYVQQTSEDYLRVLAVDVIRGRYFDRLEVERTAPVVVIGEGVARAIWGADDPVGHDAGRMHPSLAGHRIIGVATEVVAYDIRESGGRASALYRPLALEDYPFAQLFVRMRADEPAATRNLQAAVMSRLPDLRPRFTSLAASFENQMLVLGLPARVAGVSAVVVLFLAALGLGGVAATLVRQRRRELAIRVALGASRGQVMRLVVGHILRPVAIGVLAGAGLAALLGSALQGVLVGVSPVDPVSMLIGALILFASGAVAIAGPARVAARVAPGQLLKEG